MSDRTGGQLVVDTLLAHGVTTAFGVPGESYLAVLDALHDVDDRLRLVTTRHEGAASFMAEAWGKLTGEPGVCLVTRGPGATNASIGVHTAAQNSSPMVLLVGQVPTEHRGREAFQEIDYHAFFGSVAKQVVEIDDVDRAGALLADAFAAAVTGRPGPVVVSLPEDMLTDRSASPPGRPRAAPLPAPAPDDIEAIEELLATAERP